MTRRLALGGKMKAEWERLGTVEIDSEPGVEHAIDRKDGLVRCACKAFRFAKGQLGTPGKTCKHIEAFGALSEGTVRATVDRLAAKTGTRERFTVRRAFDFGPSARA